MDFARKEMEKYGWAEGKGLGKTEDGISSAIKPKLKFDNAGLGHNVGEEFTNNWWENLYNKASNNIDVQTSTDKSLIMNVKSKDAVEITNKSYSVKDFKKNKNPLEYGSFVMSATLYPYGTNPRTEGEDIATTSSGNSVMKGTEIADTTKLYQPLTDEELFAACGGRTAHKGARHGLKLIGKLSRIEKQEKMLLKKMRSVSLTEDNAKVEKKLKKLKHHKHESIEKYTPLIEDNFVSIKPLKNKNKKRKSVTFNDNVTTYTVELDTSFDGSEVGSLNNNEDNNNENNAGSDEGIEQDIVENNNNDMEDNHRAFEEARMNFKDLSKAERKKLKKKRKREAKKNASTNVFLQNIKPIDESEYMEEEKECGTKKRKYLESRRNEVVDKNTPGTSLICNNSSRRYRKKLKYRKLENQVHSITNSLTSFCRISDCF